MSNDVSTLIMSLVMAVSVVGLIVYAIMAASLWKIFKENGEQGYKAIVPLYNMYILMKLVSMPTWMLLLYFIPIVNLFALAFLSVRVANTFEKGAGFAIGLLFFPFIFYPLLALGLKKEEVVEIKEETEEKICPICGTALAKDATSCFVCGEDLNDKIEKLSLEEPVSKEEIAPLKAEEPYEEEKEEPFESPSISYDYTEEESPFVFPAEPTFTVDEPNPPIEPEESYEKPEEKVPSIDELLKVDTEYKEEFTESPKYKSSTKTLDEILRINSDLYAAQEADRKEREKQRQLEEEKEKAAHLTKQAEELLKMIDEVEKEPIEPKKIELPFIEEEPIEESIILPKEEPSYSDLSATPSIFEPELPSVEENGLLKELEVGNIKEEMNQVKEPETKTEGRLRTCPSCGSTIPRYSHRCLLCGTQID